MWWKFFLTSSLWDIAEAADTAVFLLLWKWRMIIQLLYDIPFGKQRKMRACFLSGFLVWMLSSLEKKALYCTKENVECLHVTCCPIMEYSKSPLSRRRISHTERRHVTALFKCRVHEFLALFYEVCQWPTFTEYIYCKIRNLKCCPIFIT